MIEIKNIKGEVIYSTEINKGAKRKFLLMKEDYVTLPFSLAEPLSFPIGSYSEIDGIRYEVTDLQKSSLNTSTGGYDYQLRLDAYYWKWKNKIFKFTPEVGGQEASWSLTASLDVHLGIFLRNLKALGFTFRGIDFEFSIDATVENKAIVITYENMNMIDALSAMAEQAECEWWVTDHTIHFGRCEYGEPIDFEIGNNVVSMGRSESQSDYATRLYVFGSTKNLPRNYRPASETVVVNGVVQRRLMLPEGTPYIDAYEGMSESEAIEQVVVFEDVFPKFDGNVSSVETYEDTIQNEDGTESKETFYRFKDNGITFSKDYILEGEELKIRFTSGSLNGMDFGIVFNPNGVAEKVEDGWNPEAQLFEIVVNEDYGRKLPDNTLHPNVGDTYVLYGWDSTKLGELGLVEKAEKELYEKGLALSKKKQIDPSTYNCQMFSDYMYGIDGNGNFNTNYSKHFEVGDRVNLINKAFFENGRKSRIIGFEYNLDYPYDSPVYTVGETASYSRIGALEDKIEALTYAGNTYVSGSGSSVYVIGTNDTTKATNKNVYSALRSQQMFLRKDKDDETAFGLGVGKDLTVRGGATIKGTTTTKEVIAKDSAHSEEFVSGFTGGKGWAIRFKEFLNAAGITEKKAVAEFDDVIVRGALRVYEFIISQMLGENDNRIFTGMMEVDHYDAAEGKVYLKTNNGKLYNPFRVDDVIIVQQYGGMPTEDSGYYVTKQYEFIVTEVGIGNTEDGEDRLDWLKFRSFSTPMEGGSETLITERDTLVRLDNLSDANRKGIIQLMSVGEDTPYMDFIYGAKTGSDNSLKGRFGNIGGIYNPLFGWLKEFGAYLTNLYAVGEFRIAHTGEDVADAIEILKGTFRTNFSQTSYDITEEADFFTNATFTNDCEYWELSEEETSYFAVGDVPQFFNHELYASENSFAGLSEYDGRSALRLTNGYAKQLNEHIRKPSTHTEYNDVNASLEKVGEEVVDTLYLSVRVYAATDSVIELGFTDSNGSFIGNDFHHNESLDASKDGYTINLSGKWDGEGDFTIKGTGDIYIDHLSLTDKPLENFRITTSTAIEQDAKSIKLIGEKVDNVSGTVTTVQHTVDAQKGDISSVAKRVSDTETSISNLTISVNGISSKVSKKVDGDKIASTINQTAQSVKISASKIDLAGQVTFSTFDSSTQNTINSKVTQSNVDSSIAAFGNTIIEGGYIKTSLINADAIVVKQFQATDDYGNVLSINSTGLFITGKEGVERVRLRGDAAAGYFRIKSSVGQESNLSASGLSLIYGDFSTIITYSGITLSPLSSIKGFALGNVSPTSINASSDFMRTGSDIVLPAPSSCPGKVIFTRTTSDCTISSSAANIYPRSGSLSSSFIRNNTAQFFISDGNYWYEFYCG